MSWKRDHPILSAVSPIVPYVMIPLALMGAVPDAQADPAPVKLSPVREVLFAEGCNEPKNPSVFAATLYTDQRSNNIVKANSWDGSEAVFQHNFQTNDPNAKHNMAGSFLFNTDSIMQIGGGYASNDDWSKRGFDSFIGFAHPKGMEGRLGFFRELVDGEFSSIGTFLHSKYVDPLFTVDGDVSVIRRAEGHTAGIRGFASIFSSDQFYLSAGGNTTDKVLTTLNGMINEGGWSFLARAKFDLKNESQFGLLSIGDEGQWSREKYDFFNHVHTGTQGLRMGNKVIPNVSAGWAPFDFQVSRHCAGIAEVYNDPNNFTGSLSAAWAPIPGVYGIARAKGEYDKGTGNLESKLYLGAYLQEGTSSGPLGLYIGTWVNPETGESSLDAFVGYADTF
jgi:hypothetical protein